MNPAQQQVPSPQYNMGYGYGLGQMQMRPPVLPYLQQPQMSMFGGGFQSPFRPSPFQFMQPNPFMMGGGMGGAMGGMGPGMGGMFGGGMPHFGLNLNFNLDQLFGAGGLFGGGGGNAFSSSSTVDDGEPYCEVCEQKRKRAERIRMESEREDEDPDYHTEARTKYVRQADRLPSNASSVETENEQSPLDGGGERIATGGDSSNDDRKVLPPPARKTKRPSTYRSKNVSEYVANPYGNDVPVVFQVHMRNRDEIKAQHRPIWNLFIRNFMLCVPHGCEPAQYAVDGMRSNRSCHPQGLAIDVHAIVCNGDFRHPHRAIDNDPLFVKMVYCMGGRPGNHVGYGKMAVLWHQNHTGNVTIDHRDHAHFSPVEGCNVHGVRVH
jgi:hypothetical protein